MKVVSDRLAQERSRYEERCCQKQSLMMPNLKCIPISCSRTELLLTDARQGISLKLSITTYCLIFLVAQSERDEE